LLQAVAEQFQSNLCGAPDPQPALVQEARRLIGQDAGTGKAADAAPPPALSPGEELAQRAIEQAKAEGTATRSALGAATLPQASEPAAPLVPFKVPNPPPSADAKQPGTVAKAGTDPRAAATPKAGSSSGDRVHVVYAGAAATAAAAKVKALPEAKAQPETAAAPAPNQKCRVWTASYGGQKSLIIRSVSDQVVNFTVLDVNATSEAREVQAFIAAYAKNGEIAGRYANQAQALDRAFELCPEG
jgi:hypothetical protein